MTLFPFCAHLGVHYYVTGKRNVSLSFFVQVCEGGRGRLENPGWDWMDEGKDLWLTVINQVWHSNKDAHAHETQEDHRVAEDAEEVDYTARGWLVSPSVCLSVCRKNPPKNEERQKKSKLTFRPLHKVPLCPQHPNIICPRAVTAQFDSLALIRPVISPVGLPHLNAPARINVQPQGSKRVGEAVEIDQVRRTRFQVAKYKSVGGRQPCGTLLGTLGRERCVGRRG